MNGCNRLACAHAAARRNAFKLCIRNAVFANVEVAHGGAAALGGAAFGVLSEGEAAEFSLVNDGEGHSALGTDARRGVVG